MRRYRDGPCEARPICSSARPSGLGDRPPRVAGPRLVVLTGADMITAEREADPELLLNEFRYLLGFVTAQVLDWNALSAHDGLHNIASFALLV